MCQSLPLSPDVKRINPNGVAALAKDVRYLSGFVDSLGNPILQENLDELQQTVNLMQSDNSDEFYDIAIRNKKYGRVDAMNGPILLEKSVLPTRDAQNYFMLMLNSIPDSREPSKIPLRKTNLRHWDLVSV